MTLQQSAGGQNSLKSQSKATRFTIDSILDLTPESSHETNDNVTPVTSVFCHRDDQVVSTSAIDGDDPEETLRFTASRRRREDSEFSQTKVDHISDNGASEALGEVEYGLPGRSDAGRRSVQCSSLLARTATAFHRRHQHRVAQLRSFSELFFVKYQQYQRQLRNHFRHHQPTSISVIPRSSTPVLPCSFSGVDYRHRSPNSVRSSSSGAVHWRLRGHASDSPSMTSTPLQPRASRSASNTVNSSSVDPQPPTALSGIFVDSDAVHASSTSQSGISCAERKDEFSIVDYSNNRYRRDSTTSNNSGKAKASRGEEKKAGMKKKRPRSLKRSKENAENKRKRRKGRRSPAHDS